MAKRRRPPSKRDKRPEPLWTARNGEYDVECHDFQTYKISDPPDIDDDPIILPFPDKGVRHE